MHSTQTTVGDGLAASMYLRIYMGYMRQNNHSTQPCALCKRTQATTNSITKVVRYCKKGVGTMTKPIINFQTTSLSKPAVINLK